MATGAYFSYRNYADYATLSAFNSQTYVASLPLTNLQDHRLSKKARTSGSTANKFSVGVDCSSFAGLGFNNIKVVGLFGLNFLNNDPLQTGNSVVATLNFSNASIGATDVGTFTTGSFTDNFPSGMPTNLFFIPNGNNGFGAKFISVSVGWQNSGTYLEAGRLWIGDGIVMPAAIEEGWQQTVKDLSTVQRSRGGQIYSDIRQRFRNTRVEIKQVSRNIIYAPSGVTGLVPTFQEMFLNAGMSSEVVVVPRSNLGTGVAGDDYAFMNHTGIYGPMAAQPVITNLSGDFYNLAMEFDESL